MRALQRHFSKIKPNICIILTIAVCCVFVYIFLYNGDKREIILGDGGDINIPRNTLFEFIDIGDFPTITDNETKIPKIIHQTWKDIYIPNVFQANVRTFVDLHPGYQYYYWTDASGRLLIEEKHPQLLETFDTYVEPIRRADMLKYVVLYEFGGIYADLDTTCHRNLDRVLKKFSCIISPEPFEHASLIYNTRFMVTNSIMFCRPTHPFMRMLMYNLPRFSHFSQDIDASGPNYVTLQLDTYRSEQRLNESHPNYVYIPSSQYFQNDIDPVRFDQFRAMCGRFDTLNDIAKAGCLSLKRRGLVNRRCRYAFTRHLFYHTGYKWIPYSAVNISDLVKHVKIYQGAY